MSTLAMSGWDDVLFLWTPISMCVVCDYHVRILIRWWNVTNMMYNGGLHFNHSDSCDSQCYRWMFWLMMCSCDAVLLLFAPFTMSVVFECSVGVWLWRWYVEKIMVPSGRARDIQPHNCDSRGFRWISSGMYGCDDVLILGGTFLVLAERNSGMGISIQWWYVENMITPRWSAYYSTT